jgi:hypothetical protein
LNTGRLSSFGYCGVAMLPAAGAGPNFAIVLNLTALPRFFFLKKTSFRVYYEKFASTESDNDSLVTKLFHEYRFRRDNVNDFFLKRLVGRISFSIFKRNLLY